MKFDHRKFAKEFLECKFAKEYKSKRHFGLRELGKKIGVSASTLSRLHYGNKMDIDSILLVCKWMNKKITQFIK